MYILVCQQIIPEVITLLSNPVQRNAYGQMNQGVIHTCTSHFLANGCQGEDVVIFIFILTEDERLMPFADDIIFSVIDQQVILEVGFLIVDGP